MKSSAKNISLTSLDDLFSTEEERSKDMVGSIVNIPLSQLHDFPNHPFKVRDDEKMQETVESVKAYGVLVPAIVRQRPDGEYEIVAGHRRKRASELAGLSELPAIVRDLDDDAATIIMVDSNLQRENILPSERAQAYKMKLEAIKRQGERRDVFGQGKAIHPIERVDMVTGKLFDDGEHILYVNGEYRDDSDIGKLMHDFSCWNPDEMSFELMKEAAKYYKENPEGVEFMCKAFEETRNEGIAKGREQERLENIRTFMKKLNLSAEQVMNVMLKLPSLL